MADVCEEGHEVWLSPLFWLLLAAAMNCWFELVFLSHKRTSYPFIRFPLHKEGFNVFSVKSLLKTLFALQHFLTHIQRSQCLKGSSSKEEN